MYKYVFARVVTDGVKSAIDGTVQRTLMLKLCVFFLARRVFDERSATVETNYLYTDLMDALMKVITWGGCAK